MEAIFRASYVLTGLLITAEIILNLRKRTVGVEGLIAATCLLSFIVTFISFYLLYGHFPIIYARENLFFLSLVIYFTSTFYLKNKEKKFLHLAGLLLALALLLGSFLISYKPEQPNPFLQSLWLYLHSGSAAIAHTLYIVAFILSVSILLSGSRKEANSSFGKQYESLIKYVKFAFIFHTIMIASGSMWAQKAWGRLWGWDPVEAWSLAAWLMYAAFLHLSAIRRSRSRFNLIFVFVGFVMLIVSFWGIAYVARTVHTYLKL